MKLVRFRMSSIGDRIRERREALGLDWKQLAKASGVRWQTIQQLEKFPKRGSKFIVPLARALIVSPEWLYDATGPEPLAHPPP